MDQRNEVDTSSDLEEVHLHLGYMIPKANQQWIWKLGQLKRSLKSVRQSNHATLYSLAKHN